MRSVIRIAAFLGVVSALLLGSSSAHAADYTQLVSKAQSALRAGREAQALTESKAAIALASRRWQAYVVAGGALQIEGKYDQAIDNFTRALKLAPAAKQAGVKQLLEKCVRAQVAATSAAPAVGDSSGNAPESKALKISSFLVKDLREAQDAMKAKQYGLEVQKLQDAMNAAGERTGYDDYVINSWLGAAQVQLHNYAAAVSPLEAAAESQYASGAQRNTWLQAVLGICYQERDYGKAIEIGQEEINDGSHEPDVYTTIALSQNAQGNYRGAAQTIEQLVDREPKPEEKYLIFQWKAYTKANDQEAANKIIEKLVTYYPKPDYWLNALQPLLMNISDAHLQLDVYRLMFDVGVMRPMQYEEMAELALDAGFPGETVAVLQKAFANNVFTNQRDVSRYQHLLAGAKQKALEDEASLPAQELRAERATSGTALVAVGAAYLSYGEITKAVAAINNGIDKGMLQHSADALLLLGRAQLRLGNTSVALRSFKKVAQSGTEGYAMLSGLWELRAEGATAAGTGNAIAAPTP